MELLETILRFGLIIPAIVLHEVSHGYVAYRLGDPTAKERGRLTLNPLKHIDPFGTIILPLLLSFAGGPVIGYAKPVPVSAWYFRDRRMGMFLTGIAGPSTNIALAIASGLLSRFASFLSGGTSGALEIAAAILALFAWMNLILAFFNMIPLPPMDGSRVLPLFLSDKAMHVYDQIERYGFLILIALLWILPDILGFNPLGIYFDYTAEPLWRLLVGG